jgi:hypothetical protein
MARSGRHIRRPAARSEGQPFLPDIQGALDVTARERDAVPHFLWKPHVLSGYRTRLTAWQCVQSCFRLHNETANIWTHLVGAVVFFLLAIRVGCDPGPEAREALATSSRCLPWLQQMSMGLRDLPPRQTMPGVDMDQPVWPVVSSSMLHFGVHFTTTYWPHVAVSRPSFVLLRERAALYHLSIIALAQP